MSELKTFCPQCGFNVVIDEDGCCATCGCDATGPAVDELWEHSFGGIMDFERVETVLFKCRKALELLHPVMSPDEPCVAYEAYEAAGKLLIELEDLAQTDRCAHDEECDKSRHDFCDKLCSEYLVDTGEEKTRDDTLCLGPNGFNDEPIFQAPEGWRE